MSAICIVTIITITIMSFHGNVLQDTCRYPLYNNLSSIRPDVTSTKSGNCYWMFKEGPCTPAEWFVTNKDITNRTQQDDCHQRLCPEGSEDNLTKNFYGFWVMYNGLCYFTIAENTITCSTSTDWPRFGDKENKRQCGERFPSGRDWLDNPLLKGLKTMRGY